MAGAKKEFKNGLGGSTGAATGWLASVVAEEQKKRSSMCMSVLYTSRVTLFLGCFGMDLTQDSDTGPTNPFAR